MSHRFGVLLAAILLTDLTATSVGVHAASTVPLRLSLPAAPVPENSVITIRVRTAPRASVTLQLRSPGGPWQRWKTGKAGAHGRFSVSARESNIQATPEVLEVRVSVRSHGMMRRTQGRFTVQPFQFGAGVSGIHVLRFDGAAWVPAAHVQPGETIRVIGEGFITEPAGNEGACPTSALTLWHRAQPLAPIPASCLPPATVYFDVPLPEGIAVSELRMTIDASFENGHSSITVPIP